MNDRNQHPEMMGAGGGKEEPYLSPHEELRLIRMLTKAGERYNLHASVRTYMVKKAAHLARHKDPNVSLTAIRRLMGMDQIDQKDEHHAVDLVLGRRKDAAPPIEFQNQVVVVLPDNNRRTIEVNGQSNGTPRDQGSAGTAD